MAIAANSEDYAAGYKPEEEAQDEANGARALDLARNLARKNAAAGVEEVKQEAFRKAAELAKQRARQLVLRRVAWAFAATLVGLIVAYLIMTAQIILGNWLKVSGVPPLELWEQIVWGVVSLLILFILILFLVILILVLRMALNPAEFVIHFGAQLLSWFGGILGL